MTVNEITPEMIAAAWGAWKSRHGGKLGPGPAFVEALTAALAAAPAPQPVAPSAEGKPSSEGHRYPEWLWYCESTSGTPVVTFGRWPKHPQQARYKLAEIQPTEHDHPAEIDRLKAENEAAKREARFLAQSMWEQSYSHVPEWQMLDDTAGIIIQISNMAAGIRDRALSAEAEVKRLEKVVKDRSEEIDALEEEGCHVDDDYRKFQARIAELEASEKRMREALEPFAEVSEKDIGDDEDDADWFRTMERRHARGPIITVGHFRRARAALAKEGE